MEQKVSHPIFASHLRENAISKNGVVVQLVRIPACHAGGGRGFESRPYRWEPKTRGANSKTSPSYSVNMEDFFFLSCLSRKPRKRQKKTKHLTQFVPPLF